MTDLDDWLERHPRLDKAYTLYLVEVRARARHAWNWYPDLKDRRRFKPGDFFLDHGEHPCVIVRQDSDSDAVHGVSLVDGSFKVSDRYHCDPRPTDQKTAVNIAKGMKEAKAMVARTSLEGSTWRDSNGHVLTVSGVDVRPSQDSLGVIVYQIYGETSNCSRDICGDWWYKVHTNENDEHWEYHMKPRAWGSEAEIASGKVFGWERFDD